MGFKRIAVGVLGTAIMLGMVPVNVNATESLNAEESAVSTEQVEETFEGECH